MAKFRPAAGTSLTHRLHFSVISDGSRGGHWWLAAIRRMHRWRPRTHPRVWSYAIASGLVIVGVLRIAGDRSSVLGLAVGAAFPVCCTGGLES